MNCFFKTALTSVERGKSDISAVGTPSSLHYLLSVPQSMLLLCRSMQFMNRSSHVIYKLDLPSTYLRGSSRRTSFYPNHIDFGLPHCASTSLQSGSFQPNNRWLRDNAATSQILVLLKSSLHTWMEYGEPLHLNLESFAVWQIWASNLLFATAVRVPTRTFWRSLKTLNSINPADYLITCLFSTSGQNAAQAMGILHIIHIRLGIIFKTTCQTYRYPD